MVLQRLLENKLYVSLDKCKFHVPSVSILGYIIAKGQVRPDPIKIEAVINWPTPSNSSWAWPIFNRRFIHDCSKVELLLTYTKSPFCWTQDGDRTFTKLKSLFMSAPILKHPDPSLRFPASPSNSPTCCSPCDTLGLCSHDLL
ncbi:uncharacterized protein LOC133480906 [Phyllopteryx taeniolatus]|uniref:uncharacterized protein LOC133480906 n=1 Tax=Phyllopteryx taeniolatus TaxID=161469 RepID=UPI002AD4CFB6|nr:uncharacterized protein LOC133480906 [Phyllopteryx taeniolatus]